MRILTAFGFFASLLVVAGPSPAEEPSGPPPLEGEAAPGAPAPLQGELALSVQDAIVLAVENNLDVEIARYEPLISDLDHTSAWGAYDPNAFASFGHSSTDSPVASTFEPSAVVVDRETSGGAGVVGLIPRLGGQYEISYGGQRFTTTQAIPNLSPEYRASVLGSLTVPLLKGAWWGAPWILIRQTGIGAEISHEDFRKNLMDLLQATENAYWSVSASGEKRRVSRKSLEASQALLDQTKAQYEVGVVSRVEVTESEAGLAQREVDVIVAENGYRATQDRLIDLVLGPNLTPDSSLEVRPTDSPEEIASYEVDPEEANRKALVHRPEIVSARKNVELGEVELKFRKNQRLPQVDLQFTYGYQGLGGKTNPAPPVFCPTGVLPPCSRAPVTSVGSTYSSAHDDFFDSDGASQWSGGAVVTIPIGNVSARAGASRAELELRRARTLVRRLELDIVIEVREAIRNLESALEGIEAAERRRVAAEEQLRAESIRLEYGESTPFDVLQREEDLVDAESQKILALQLYHTSITALDRAQGTILDNRNIVVEEAAALR